MPPRSRKAASPAPRSKSPAPEKASSRSKSPAAAAPKAPSSPHALNSNSRFSVGDLVLVTSRTGPGENKPGGVGTVTDVHQGGHVYDVKYILGGKEKGVQLQFVSSAPDSVNPATPSKSSRKKPPAAAAAASAAAVKSSSKKSWLPSLSDPLTLSTVVISLADLLGFVISVTTGSHLHLDVIGTGAFFLSTLVLMTRSSPSGSPPSSLPICLWSLRLASFLFFRATVLKHDARLGETLGTVSGMFGFWFISAVWGIVCTLPSRMAWGLEPRAAAKKQEAKALLAGVRACGWALFVGGFLFECVADFQKWTFKQQGGTGPMITGVWSLCQHPNYTGEIMCWVGLFLLDFPRLYSKFGWKSVALSVSPLFISLLLVAQSLGYLAPTLELAANKYAQFQSYETYINETPLFIPSLRAWS